MTPTDESCKDCPRLNDCELMALLIKMADEKLAQLGRP